MRADIDRLMDQDGLYALLVLGPASHNPNKQYFTGPAHVTGGYLLKIRGLEPVLFHHSMERDEAAGTGLATRDLNDYDPSNLIDESGGDTLEASARLIAKILDEYGVEGRVALYGRTEVGPSFGVMDRLASRLNGIEFVGEPGDSAVLIRARATKDEDEVSRIRGLGKITTKVVRLVAEYLTSHTPKEGVLVNRQGVALTVGEVRRRIDLWLGTEGAENLEGTIFAIGRDAAVPHSAGTDSDYLRLGETIVFDIFPSEAGGGYFYDFTRTWCLGHAPDGALDLHRDVLDAHQAALETLSLGAPTRESQIATCELFESRGHPTVLNTPGTTDGYVHSLGHGLGLDVHERPKFSHLESNDHTIEPGAVFTIEPGLYYPERGMGVRIEDTVWANPNGTFEVLAHYPTDLVLEMAGT